jgi:hypothetical protein
MSAIPLGARVRRGPAWPDWSTLDMKFGVPAEGTVYKIELVEGGPYYSVKWDNGNKGSGFIDSIQLYEETEHQRWSRLSRLGEHKVAEKAEVHKDIKKLLGSKETSNFMVVCGGEEMPCHRAILWARSEAFRGGVVSVMTEGIAARWTVEGAEPAAVRDMITYIYTGEVPAESLNERAGELLDLATQYVLPGLAADCKRNLLGGLSVDSAVRTLVLMDRSLCFLVYNFICRFAFRFRFQLPLQVRGHRGQEEGVGLHQESGK